MEKAYDLKALGEELKKAGLPLAEEVTEKIAAQVYKATKQWLKDSATMSENKIDDIVATFLDQADEAVEKAIAGIDLDGNGQ